MLQAMNTGHDGFICTIHCQQPRATPDPARDHHDDGGHGAVGPCDPRADRLGDPADRLPTAPEDGTRRFTHVTEVAGMEGEVITLQDIFLFDFSSGIDEEGRFRGRLKSTGLRPKFLDKLAERGVVHGSGGLRAGAEGSLTVLADTFFTSHGAQIYARAAASAWSPVLMAWFLLGSAARAKKDRAVEARMRAVIQPGSQPSSKAAVAEPGTGWIPDNVVEVRDAVRAVAGLQRPAGRASSRPRACRCARASSSWPPRSRRWSSASSAPRSCATVPRVGRSRRRRRVPDAVAAQRARQARRHLREQLPDVLTIMASSLRAGHSFLQALDTVGEGDRPAGGHRVPAGRRGDPAGPSGRGRARGPGRARRQRRLQVGGARGEHPARGRRQPGRDPGQRGRHAARAATLRGRSRSLPPRAGSPPGSWRCCPSASRCT